MIRSVYQLQFPGYEIRLFECKLYGSTIWWRRKECSISYLTESASQAREIAVTVHASQALWGLALPAAPQSTYTQDFLKPLWEKLLQPGRDEESPSESAPAHLPTTGCWGSHEYKALEMRELWVSFTYMHLKKNLFNLTRSHVTEYRSFPPGHSMRLLPA